MNAPHESRARADVLRAFGASTDVAAEILSYESGGFGEAVLRPETRFPLDDEPFVETWRAYEREASKSGLLSLSDRLVQLSFPIKHGISETAEYHAVTRRGAEPKTARAATGLVLEHPADCQVTICESWAGSIPVIQANGRNDFVSLVQAFTARNEPVPVPESAGAWIIAGYNNWDRFHQLRDRWLLENPDHAFSIARVAPLKELYQDRFILLSDGCYSGVPPEAVHLDATTWRSLSITIRREHECAHYWTRRVFSSMRNHVLDEIVADYCGIAAACGRFRADWLLMFFGLEQFPHCRDSGRLHNYRGQPPLSDEAFALVQKLVCAAAANLDAFSRLCADELAGRRGILRALLTLSTSTLEDLACREGQMLLREKLRQYGSVAEGVSGTLPVS